MRHKAPFGSWLKQRRKALDLTQAEFAGKVGCATDTVKKIESGALRPSKQLAELMASFISVSPDEYPAFVMFARAAGGDPPATPRFETVHSSAPIASPKAAARFRVPVPLAPLVGREREMLAGRRLLAQPGTRLLTLYGPPGVGKTRLAAELALATQDDLADGACFVSLAAIVDPGTIPQAIAAALRLREVAGARLLATVQSFLAEKHLLLVLDNFEQILVAAPVVTELLAAAQGVKALVTSRELLHVYGEQGFPVPPLPVPDVQPGHWPPLDALALYPSVELFAQRARATKPDFALTAANAGHVAQICAWLDGLPLAIEMAAAQVKWVPLPRLLAQLSHRLATLTGGLRDLSPRQQTLRGAIDWSYELLDPQARRLFTRLAVFADGCTAHAAQAVVAGWELSSLELPSAEPASATLGADLELLADKSLLRAATVPEGEARFSMFETIREYAREKLQQNGEESETQRRHAACYLQLAQAAEPELNGPLQATWQARLTTDINNLRAALDWYAANDVTAGLHLAMALWQFWIVYGALTEGRARLDDLLARCNADTPATLRARAWRASAALAHQQGNPDRARELANQSLTIFRAHEDRAGIASALHLLANVAMMQSDYAPAMALYGEALALYRELGYRFQTAQVLMNLGLIAKDQGNYARSIALYQESQALHRQLGNKRGLAAAHTHMSIAYYWIADFAQAVAQAEQALTLYRESGARIDQAYTLENLGMSLFKQGDLARAAQLLDESIAILRDLGDKSGIALVLTDLGLVAYAQGDLAQAAARHRAGLTYSLEVGDKRRIAFCLEGLAMALIADQARQAAQLFGAAGRLRAAIGTPLPPSERAGYDAGIARLRDLLGDDAVEMALDVGRSMTLDEVVALARRG